MAGINWIFEGLELLVVLGLIFVVLLIVAVVVVAYHLWQRRVARRIMRGGRW